MRLIYMAMSASCVIESDQCSCQLEETDRGRLLSSSHHEMFSDTLQPMPKEYLPKFIIPGGRNGAGVTSIRTKPNSFVRGAGDRVFETDQDGKVIKDIDKDRVKLRKTHHNKAGEVFEKMEKAGRPNLEEIEILRRMGVLK